MSTDEVSFETDFDAVLEQLPLATLEAILYRAIIELHEPEREYVSLSDIESKVGMW